MSNSLSLCAKLNVLHLLNVWNGVNVENGGRLPAWKQSDSQKRRQHGRKQNFNSVMQKGLRWGW